MPDTAAPATADNVLNVNALVKRFGGDTVVDGLSFAIPRGTCFGLLGPNGAGKTTTLRMCLGLIPPDSGTISLVGEPVPTRGREARVRVGVCPQLDNLDPDFSVYENLLVYGRYFGLSDAQCHARIPDLLAFASLEPKRDARIQSLSGGMKRRLTLVRALINDPDILFLDEPTTGLDPQARHLIWERLRELLKRGKTLLLTTHFMEEAERLCTRLAIIDHGKKVTEGSPTQLIADHIEPEVVEVYGDGLEAWVERYGKPQSARLEKSGETVFCYTSNGEALANTLKAEAGLRYLRRPANLEDVFIKLTGRDLRD
jgi:lipooligosaccharide transport system ATP-binding protein